MPKQFGTDDVSEYSCRILHTVVSQSKLQGSTHGWQCGASFSALSKKWNCGYPSVASKNGFEVMIEPGDLIKRGVVGNVSLLRHAN